MKDYTLNFRLAYILVIILFVANEAVSQRFYAVVFDKLPQDYQLYPRKELNEAIVPINGIIEFKDWNYMSVQVLRNGKPYAYKRAPITYPKVGNGRFGIEIPIKAELAEYDFLVYAVKSPDSVLMVTRKNVVAGDVFLVSGQSNSYNGSESNRIYKGEFARSFGYSADYINYATYNPADTLWDIANNRPKVGLWASEFQRLMIEKYKIPICIINGGSGGSSMQYNLIRSSDPADLTTSSGRLYYRVKKAGLLESIKAFIYRQGEHDANDNAGALIWKESMVKHMDALKKEYPGLQQFYIPQINVLEGNQGNQGLVRESQRQLVNTSPLIKGFATIGTQGYDGVHYTPDGYFQSAADLYRIVASTQYGAPEQKSQYSPNIQRAYFSTSDKLNVVLEFDQPVIVQSDTAVANKNGQLIKRTIAENLGFSAVKFNENYEWIIQNVKAVGNNVIIQLYEPPAENRISYIPSIHATSELGPFAGPFIKNSQGMRAFAFQNVSIESPPSPNVLNSKVTFSQIPQDYQLFPRDQKSNLGQMKIIGSENSGNFSKISILVLRGQSKVYYASSKLSYQNNSASFSLSAPLTAEKLNYSLRVYLVNSSNDSTLIASRKELVAGDIIVVNGNNQVSNGYNEGKSDPFIRTFGSISSNFVAETYNRSDTLWSVANTLPSNNIGKFAYALANKLLDKLTYPLAIINAADTFSSTSDLGKTNSDLTSNFGKLSYRINQSNSNENVRAYFLQSGEVDKSSDLIDWAQKMELHLSQIRKLLPKQTPIFIGQSPLQKDSTLAAQIREAQRKISNAIIIPTYGIAGFDGNNFSDVGIINFSNHISKVLLTYLYENARLPLTTFPNLTKAIQSVKDPSKLILTFDTVSNLNLANIQKSTLISYFKVNQNGESPTDILAQGNQLILTTASESKKSSVSFLSGGIRHLQAISNLPLEPIFNLQGQILLSFDQVTIQQALPSLVVKLQSQAYNKVVINWSPSPVAKAFRIERKMKANLDFQALATVPANQVSFSDTKPIVGALHDYRVFALTDSSESDISNTLSVTLADSLIGLNPKVQSTYNSISISWPSVQGASGYIVEKKSAQGKFIAVSENQNTQFTDTDLNANTIYEYKVYYLTADGISKTAYVKYQTELALATEPPAHGVQAYPNPTQNSIRLSWDKPFTGELSLIQLDGSQIEIYPINYLSNFDLNLKELPAGVYFIKLKDQFNPPQINILKVIRQH
ncbi:MAG: sialate O-acetylesterase [Aquirufa sp.]